MRWIIGVVLVLLAVPVVAAAQTAPAREPGQLPVEIRRGETTPEAKVGRLIVRPPAQDAAALREAERAPGDLEQARRDERFIRSETRQLPRRPDLGYDVYGGIQQRNLQRSLSR